MTPAPYRFSMTLVKQTDRNPYGVPDGTVFFRDRVFGSGDTVVDIVLALAFIPENRYPARLVIGGSCADALHTPAKQPLDDVHMGKSSTLVRHVSASALEHMPFSVAILDVAGERVLWCATNGRATASPRPVRS